MLVLLRFANCGSSAIGVAPPSNTTTVDACKVPNYACADAFANLYGTYLGEQVNIATSHPVVITYSARGLVVQDQVNLCGNALPIAPSLVAPGAMEWRQRIEYGISNCAQGTKASLTQDDEEWEMVIIHNGETAISRLTLDEPECSEEEIQGDNLPSPVVVGNTCDDPKSNPYGNFTGIMTQTDTQTTYAVSVVYNERGVIVSYPTLECGNLLPIVRTNRHGVGVFRMERTHRVRIG